MFDIDKWEEILQTLLRNKSRSVLTAFGIFWGVFMLVLLMGGGKGLQRGMAANFEGLAQNSCFLMGNLTSKAYKGLPEGRSWDLQLADVERLRRLSGLETVTPMQANWGHTAVYRDATSSVTVKGLRPEYVRIENPCISHGRFLTEADERSFRKVCVIGSRVCEELFPGEANPCGRFIDIDGVFYQVVGVSQTKSSVGLMGQASQSVAIPFSTYGRIYNMGTATGCIGFTVAPGHTVTEVLGRVEQTVREANSIAPDDTQALYAFNMESMYRMVDSLFSGIETLVWLIGLGTLFSGAIGVSNIMMVTVRERTSEIGIRRALGARPGHILAQVMAESMVLTVLAGLSGIVAAVLVLWGVESALQADGSTITLQVSFGLAIGSAAALALLGSLAGIAPSLRALAVRPIEAIRDE